MDRQKWKQILYIISWCMIGYGCIFIPSGVAKTQHVTFVVSSKKVNFTGKSAKAIVVNNQLPGPTLHFKYGDKVSIRVINHLKREGTTVHWHGILVPWRMDGVAYVSQLPINPGESYLYHYPLKQFGTYWYHSHDGFQEQQGLYGAYIIDPPHPRWHYTKDFVVLLGDWSNTNPNQIYANLKKSGDYYGPRFPLQPSLAQFISDYRHAKTKEERAYIVKAYKAMQIMRMSPYDISDVAYDTFLMNGHPSRDPWIAKVKVGDVVRLRFIGAGASSFFDVKIPGAKMKMINADGNDIKPYSVSTFEIGPGETFDVLVRITKNQPYMIYAESIDKVGAAYGALITQANQHPDFNSIIPFPKPLPKVMQMSHGSKMNMSSGMQMEDMQDHSSSHKMNMSSGMQMQDHPSSHKMDMSKMPKKTVNGVVTSPGTKYAPMVSLVKTNNPSRKPDQVINMVLSGYMDRYIWFINGLTESQAKPISIEKGKKYRLVFKNTSMMNHPMHIHGHWFILQNGHGAYNPLMHTLNVPPGKTIVVDFIANETGQWYFHCHNLYHMMAGMARIFRYQASPAIFGVETRRDNKVVFDPLDGEKPKKYLANRLDIAADFPNNSYEGTFKSLFGGDYNKLEILSKDAEIEKGSVSDFDVDIFYWRAISQFWAIKGGVNYFNKPSNTPYWQPGVGIEGLAPYFIDTDIRVYYHNGSVKFDLDFGRDTQITRNIFIGLEFRSIWATKTVNSAQIGSGLNQMQFTFRPFYRLRPGLDIFVQYEYDRSYGVFKRIQLANGDGVSSHLYAVGFSWLF